MNAPVKQPLAAGKYRDNFGPKPVPLSAVVENRGARFGVGVEKIKIYRKSEAFDFFGVVVTSSGGVYISCAFPAQIQAVEAGKELSLEIDKPWKGVQ